MIVRREFITLLGGAAVARPMAARAQQPAMPVIGFLGPTTAEAYGGRLRELRDGLKETGYVEGENVLIEYRWAESQVDRLPELAADLVRKRVAVIATTGGANHVFAAKAATPTIPIVFYTANDPVSIGLVASLGRPGGNVTGVTSLGVEMAPKRLELLRELLPGATRVGLLVNPTNTTITDATLKDMETAARALGLQTQVVRASAARELTAAFATFARERIDALFVAADPFFRSRLVQLALLGMRYGVPAIYSGRDYVEAGGLMSYGSSLAEAFRQVGIYTGRILKGAKPADLPVIQAAKFELVINRQAAELLGLTVSQQLLARADEVIE